MMSYVVPEPAYSLLLSGKNFWREARASPCNRAGRIKGGRSQVHSQTAYRGSIKQVEKTA